MSVVRVSTKYRFNYKAGQLAKQVSDLLEAYPYVPKRLREKFDGGRVNTYRKLDIIPTHLIKDDDGDQRRYPEEAASWIVLSVKVWQKWKSDTTLDDVGDLFEDLWTSEQAKEAENLEMLLQKMEECFDASAEYVGFVACLKEVTEDENSTENDEETSNSSGKSKSKGST